MNRPTDARVDLVVLAARAGTEFSHQVGDVIVALADDLQAALALLREAKEGLRQAEDIIRDEVEDADLDVGYGPFIAKVERFLAQHPTANEQPKAP